MSVSIKRAYEEVSATDGTRILVDRLWPRGLTKEKVRADLWLKEVGPSNELRKWFGHDPKRWTEFRSRYREELKHNPVMAKEMAQLRQAAAKGHATLIYSAKDEEHNQAVVLRELLSHK